MPEHDSWFSVVPGLKNLDHNLKIVLEMVFGKSYVEHRPLGTQHVWAALTVLAIVCVGVVLSRLSMSRSKEPAIPDDTLTVRNFFEIITETLLGLMANIMGGGEKGRAKARDFLPLVGALAFFIFFSNVLGLIPGFQPATASLNTTLAPAVIVFVMTHVYGLRRNGLAYLKHFAGPVWWLAPLMIPIELISHFARPLSLSLRLLGNIFGDHTAVSIFFTMMPLLAPLPVMLLGVIVVVVQTLVFCLLSTVYIALAVEGHDEHDEHHAEQQQGSAHAGVAVH